MRPYGNPSDPNFLNDIASKRIDDVFEQDSYNEKFLLARKGIREPSSSVDVIATDLEGDIHITSDFLYVLINGAWRRTALASF